jgi:hypothetical protein
MIHYNKYYGEWLKNDGIINNKIMLLSDKLVEDYVLGEDIFINLSDLVSWTGDEVECVSVKDPQQDWHGRLAPEYSLFNVLTSIACIFRSLFCFTGLCSEQSVNIESSRASKIKVYVLFNRKVTVNRDKSVFPVLTGGFGNQIFQLFYAYIISGKKTNSIMLDDSQYLRHKYRTVEERILVMFGKSKYRISVVVRIEVMIARLLNKIYRLLFNRNVSGSICSIRFDFSNKYPDTSVKNKYVIGYFQNSNFIVNNISVYNSFIDEVICEHVSVSSDVDYINELAVSIRIGEDYINNNDINFCGSDFYSKAIGQALKCGSYSCVRIYSDDTEKAIELIESVGLELPILISASKDIFQSFYDLCNHQNIIISNSSFAWLAAAYRLEDNKTVYMPSRWSRVYTANNMVVKGWELIDA